MLECMCQHANANILNGNRLIVLDLFLKHPIEVLNFVC